MCAFVVRFNPAVTARRLFAILLDVVRHQVRGAL